MIASRDVINKAVEYIKSKLDPERVYLFGSYAKGQPAEYSDLDFLIIQKTDLPAHRRETVLYGLDKTEYIGFPIGIDFIVYTPEEYEAAKNEQNSLAGEVSRTGRLVYERKA